MRKRWRRWAICAAIAAGSVAGARLLSAFHFFELLNLKSLDTQFVLRGQLPPSNIVLVLADQKALDTIPALKMFWHPYYTAAIRAAGEGGAKVVGLDVAFGVPVKQWEPELDQNLVDAAINSPVPVVTGYVPVFNSNQQSQAVPINLYSASMGLSGFSNLTVDAVDDFARRQVLIEAESPNPNDPPPAHSFALRIAEKYLGTEAGFKDGKLILAGHPIPIGPDRSIFIRDANPPKTTPSHSLADVWAAERGGNVALLKQWFDGKIVLIGSDTVDDSYATPFYTVLDGPRKTTPGVEIEGNAVRTLIERSYLLYVPEWVRTVVLLTAAGTAAGIVISLAAGPAAAWITLEIVAIFGFTYLLFREGRILYTSETVVATLVCVVVSIIYRLLTAEQRGNLFHRAIALFVSKEVAESIEETSAIGLSGRRVNVTIMFTDIRGFTAFTEKTCDEQGPEVVVDLLNQYLAMMVSIIVKYRGRVDKFIGDGILAVFSDENEGAQPGDHPRRAVLCATEIVNAPSRFETGTGLHTGLAVVGNVGSTDKMEYTVLGDTVNLASRLESLNKEHHTKLLMSEATRSQLGGKIDTTYLGAAPVRGKSAPIKLYTVTSLVPVVKELANV
ncbi:MAG TPA: adenylate/guanylate cyclase domain-containing protein [Bryobacteraceae bacterium]|jgi:adenylate cyclase